VTPPVAIALAYAVVWSGVLLYLLRLRGRLKRIAAETAADSPPTAHTGQRVEAR
jgi:CcmD family protein